MTYQNQLRRVAGYQHGIITTADADEIDIPAVAVRRLAQRGTLRKIGHGAYRFIDFPRTTGSTEAEAIAMVGDDAYIEGESVLALLNLGHANPTKAEVATRRQVRRALPPLGENDTSYPTGRRPDYDISRRPLGHARGSVTTNKKPHSEAPLERINCPSNPARTSHTR